MFYLVIAAEVISGRRRMEDVPEEIRTTVERAVRDLAAKKEKKRER